MRETFPDAVLGDADEVVLIDLAPEALIARLREGKVYPRERVGAALGGFFRVENLQALREVALRQVAEGVEAKRLVRETLHAREERLFSTPPAPQAIAERLLALATLDPRSERVVRRAWRSAQRLGAELDILVVRDPGGEPRRPSARRLRPSGAWPRCSAPGWWSRSPMTWPPRSPASLATAGHLHPDGATGRPSRAATPRRAAGHAAVACASRRRREDRGAARE